MDDRYYRRPFELLPNRVWRTYSGGAFLDRIEGRETPQDGSLPEDWVGSAVRASNPARKGDPIPNEGLCMARTFDGRILPMTAVLDEAPEAALGARHVAAFDNRPELLVKIIDSAVRLSIQAHPTAAWAQANLNAPSGKTEAWWIIETREPDAWVLAGFQRPPSVEDWRRMMADQDSEAMLKCFDPVPVAPGDVLLIEGGLPHAIGPGITLVEIQEPTDFVVHCEFMDKTLNIPESARTMGLGVEKAAELFDFTAYTPSEVKNRFGASPSVISKNGGGTEEVLLASPRTELLEARRIKVNGTFKPVFDGRYSIMIVLDGEGALSVDGEITPLKPWTRLFLPAAMERCELEGRLSIARCLPPLPKSV